MIVPPFPASDPDTAPVLRLFPTHALRPYTSFCEGWTFYFPVNGTQIEPQDWKDGKATEVPVPGVWEMLDALKSYRGQAIARKIFTSAEAGPALLKFGGVSHTCRIFLNGEEVGDHHNAFTPFTVALPDLPAGEHELLVHVSNEHGELSALHIPNDYYNYGGISRPVELHQLKGRIYLEHLHFIPSLDGLNEPPVVDVHIQSLLSEKTYINLSLFIGDDPIHRLETYGVTPGSNRLRFRLPPLDLEPWSPQCPTLYFLRAVLEHEKIPIDDLIERIGLRTIAVKGDELHLNGAPFYPVGFNRHEDHPDWGCALPVSQMRKDLDLFAELNANAVRTSHYPNDQRFLDLCDERGFLVWEENHARGQLEPQMRHPRFREQCAACNEEMVRHHFNHPSIFVWGILNETASDTAYGRMCHQEQFAQIRSLDPTRPVTFASCRHYGCVCQDLPDIASWNIYSRWYGNADPTEDLEGLIARMGPLGLEGKPLIISEFGAGGIPGYQDPVRRAKWSEERQGDILLELITAYAAIPAAKGLFVWQFCDVRVDESWALQRPRTMNNKGVVDENRRPKVAFSVVAECFARIRRAKNLA